MLLQLLANGIVSGSAFALVALGFALIYNTTRIFHIAHGAIYTLSAYLFYTFLITCKFPFLVALILALGFTVLLGILIDEIIYIPLVKRDASLLILLLSSLGLYIVLINLVAMIYGNETKILSPGIQPTYSFGNIILTRIQIATFLTFIVIFISLVILLKKTSLGKMVRAMRDNPDLVSVMGINPKKIRRIVFALGSGLAGVASILIALDVGFDPNVGMSALLTGAVGLIIGGVGIFEGAAYGGLIIGILQSLVIWKTSARWQDMITFLVLILFLIFRPQGILGKRRRIEEEV